MALQFPRRAIKLLATCLIFSLESIVSVSAQDDFALGSSVVDVEAGPIHRIDWNAVFSDTTDIGPSVTPLQPSDPVHQPLVSRIMNDHANFYSKPSMMSLAGGFLVGGVIANSHIDRNFHEAFQENIRNADSDEWFEVLHANKELGNGMYTLPIFALAWGTQAVFPDQPMADTFGTWGERSLRSFVVGAPPMLLLQRVTGASRPSDELHSSHWHFMQDNNGVSGHAFMSSLPFITAAQMTENRWEKTAWYAGSLLGPLSRINDDAHYTSQVMLGWWVSYLAVSAVSSTDSGTSHWTMHPYISGQGTGLMAEFQW